MTFKEYQNLLKIKFIDNFWGSVKSYYSREDTPYNINDVHNFLLKELNCKPDFNNCIIVNPCQIGVGRNWIINDDTLIAHAVDTIDIRIGLDKLGITYKNGIKMTDRKYSQMRTPIIVVQNGIAYVCDNTANPLRQLSYIQDNFAEEIKIDDNDNITIEDKDIFFSGIFKNYFKKNV